ncbi:hypothetical protein SE17_19625 [Kouleothrix aurantiaca]|uniref:Uncharacterized protein n=1 Tax=Kouleothrix aurantiaca TaxID=186479 RepID=A0A0P9DF38_9CHLR|nr:hypothetical protein SE17_19625 [Kouleothrix aurantiaca]
MQSDDSNWEALLLGFALIFTVMLGVSYGVSMLFRIPVPWFVVLIVSVVVTLGLRFLRGRQRA